MGKVKLNYTREALKRLKNIPQSDQNKIKRKINILLTEPLAGKPLKGMFSGNRSFRAWPLRIIYQFNSKTKTILIITIEYRGQAYK